MFASQICRAEIRRRYLIEYFGASLEQRNDSALRSGSGSPTLVISDVDRNLGYLLRSGTAGSEITAEAGKHPADLDRQITATEVIAVSIFEFLA